MKYLKWVVIVLIIALVFGGIYILLNKLFFSKEQVAVPKQTESIEKIIDENKGDLDKVSVDKIKIEGAADIYSIIHQMANTLIVAEDDLIYGEIPINDESVAQVMAIVNNTNLVDRSEKEVLLNLLNRWKKKDFSQGVIDHNYVWNKLSGNIGKAKDLREEYKKK